MCSALNLHWQHWSSLTYFLCSYARVCVVDTSKSADESAVSRPSVDVGSNVTMLCSAKGYGNVGWLYIRFDTAEQFKIYEKESVLPQFEDTFQAVTNPSFAITLVNAQMENNGWYLCVIETEYRILDKYVTIINVTSEDSG